MALGAFVVCVIQPTGDLFDGLEVKLKGLFKKPKDGESHIEFLCVTHFFPEIFVVQIDCMTVPNGS